MKTLKPYIESVLTIWNNSSPAARIGMCLLIGTCALSIVAVGYWSVKPNYVILLSEPEGSQIDAVMSALDKEGISYKLSGGGSNLLVDERYFAKARLLARTSGAVPSEAGGGGGLMDAFMSPEEKRNIAMLQKQQRLATTIEKIDGVQNAVVHLSIPKQSPFVRDRTAPSASVLLTIGPAHVLTDRQATSIANIVAYAVEGLTPDGVQVTDKNGQSYTIASGESQQISTQVEYIGFAERKLADKAQAQLVQFLGPGNASVQISLDLDFTRGSKTTVSYPGQKVATEEELVTETTTGSTPSTSGPAGVASNLQTSGGRSGGGSDVLSKTESISSSYLVPKIEETQSTTAPLRNYMTVSVLVNSQAEGIADEQGVIPPTLKGQIEELVKNAVGYRDTSDSISVEFLPFPEAIAVDAAPFDWSILNTAIEYGALALGAILTFVIGLMLIRQMRPKAEAPADTSLNASSSGNINELSKMVEQNPEVFARLIKLWSGDEEDQDADASGSSASSTRAA